MSNMKYADIPYVNKPVSRILFGTAMPPFMMGGDGNALLDAIYETGVTTFDVARNYMAAEQSFGKWIEERNMRDKIVILSKCGHPSMFGKKRVNESEMWKDLKKSLNYLHTDYIDIYLLHRDDQEVEAGEVVEIFNAMHTEGKIGAFGGSNWSHERIAMANEYAYSHNLIPFSVSSPNYGLAEQLSDPWGGGCVSVSGPQNEHARIWYAQQKMPVIAYSSLGRGLFSGKVKSTDKNRAAEVLDDVAVKGYAGDGNFERLRRCEVLAAQKGVTVPQIAMAYIFNQNMNTFAIVSTSKAERMQENIEALSIDLSEEETAWLDLRREELP